MQKKKDRGITLVSLILTVVIMLILTTVTVSVSTNRFALVKINNMYSDIELLKDKTELYYMDNNELPIIENKTQDVSKMNSDVLNVNDNQNYYIIDFDKLDLQGINYGFGYKEIKNNSTSDDIYIINETTHTIYYYAGFEYEGTVYYRRKTNEEQIEDNIPPSKPEIKIISGTQNEEGAYNTMPVVLEFVPGKDNWSGIDRTTYSINNSAEEDIKNLNNNIYQISDEGDYEIKLKSYDKNGMVSEYTKTIIISDSTEPATTIAEALKDSMFRKTVNSDIIDEYGNKITIPAGFKILLDESTSYTTKEEIDVTKGIVITDKTNEFVWIPVGDNIINEEKVAKITLGRYSDFTTNSNGEYIPVEDGTTINSYNELETSTLGNKTAININEFITSVKQKGGYYLGRYEASVVGYDEQATNSNTQQSESTEWTKYITIEGNDPQLICSRDKQVWNYVTQSKAAVLCRRMYTSKPFISDLTNSYAWDTAIIFIQTFENSSYSTQISLNSTLSNTGTTSDKVLNIWDMASNCFEWTTETRNHAGAPATRRGGGYGYSNMYSSTRGAGVSISYAVMHYSFRPILYVNL